MFNRALHDNDDTKHDHDRDEPNSYAIKCLIVQSFSRVLYLLTLVLQQSELLVNTYIQYMIMTTLNMTMTMTVTSPAAML